MRIVRAAYNWARERRTATKLCYHSLGGFYFTFWWVVFLFVLILFTGGWYGAFFKECKAGCFSGLTMFLVYVSGITAFIKARDKISGTKTEE